MTSYIDPAAIDALLAPFDRGNAPGFAVGVALGGRPGYRRGVGLASVELPVTLSPSIRMRIGSTSKHFTVLAVMLLAEEGRLSIDDSPRRTLPELPGWAERITLRQLMAHTSGMRDSLDLLLHAAGPGMAGPADIHLRLLARLDDLNSEPGATWSYNNGGYALLSEIVARVSGMPLAVFLQERIFAPVGMHDTVLRPLDTDLLPNSATLHVPTPAGGWARGVFGVPIGGEGGIVSTVDDMLRWLRHMDAPTVGSAESWAAMRTPVATHGYGLGLFTDRWRGVTRVHHAGAVVGGSCQMIKLVEPGLDIIAMSNGLSGLDLHRLVDAIAAACVPDLAPPEPSVPAAPVTGTFHSAATGQKLTLEEAGGAQAIRIAGMTLPARRDGEGRLSVALAPTDLRVLPRADGSALDITEFGTSDVLLRVEPPARPAPIDGHYANAAAGLTLAIDGTALRLAGELGGTDYRVAAIGPRLWEARATGTLPLELLIEDAGDDLLVTTGRTRRQRFTRLPG